MPTYDPNAATSDGCLLIAAVAVYVLVGLTLLGIGVGIIGWVMGQ